MYLVITNILPLATVASSNVRTKLLIHPFYCAPPAPAPGLTNITGDGWHALDASAACTHTDSWRTLRWCWFHVPQAGWGDQWRTQWVVAPIPS